MLEWVMLFLCAQKPSDSNSSLVTSNILEANSLQMDVEPNTARGQ